MELIILASVGQCFYNFKPLSQSQPSSECAPCVTVHGRSTITQSQSWLVLGPEPSIQDPGVITRWPLCYEGESVGGSLSATEVCCQPSTVHAYTSLSVCFHGHTAFSPHNPSVPSGLEHLLFVRKPVIQD